MLFCPKCGKKGVKGLCDDCRPPSLLEAFKEKTIKYCYICKKVFIGGHWKPAKSLNEAIIMALDTSIKKSSKNVKVLIKPILVDVKENPGIDETIPVNIDAMLNGRTEKYSIEVDLSITSCIKCGKAYTQYLEGILQLRGITKGKEFVIDFVRNEFNKLKDKGMFINKEKVHKNGVDFVITKKAYLRNVSQKIISEFGGEVSFNTQLFSKDKLTSKEILRLNVLLTLPPFIKGDIVELDGSLLVVSSCKGKDIICVDLMTRKKKSFNFVFRKPLVVSNKKEYLIGSITSLNPDITILDPVDFENKNIVNQRFMKSEMPKNKLCVGKKVKIIEHNGVWYVGL